MRRPFTKPSASPHQQVHRPGLYGSAYENEFNHTSRPDGAQASSRWAAMRASASRFPT